MEVHYEERSLITSSSDDIPPFFFVSYSLSGPLGYDESVCDRRLIYAPHVIFHK